MRNMRGTPFRAKSPENEILSAVLDIDLPLPLQEPQAPDEPEEGE